VQKLNPAINAKGWVDQARYGYVPPLDMDGTPRVTGDAGAEAL
jgi:hypothetical protein